MKKFFIFTLAAAVASAISAPSPWAQESATDEFTLEEIMVTAEKREVNVQSIPASIQALPGEALVTEGKVTAAQMLESVPNLTYGEAGRSGGGPNSNISIRGVKKTQEPGGGSPVPSSTATYVDGVYDGIGGDFDINRIEVLRGPQGTLYGRSATGGVVSFHTNNPQLEKFSGNAMAEYGSGDRINAQAALNVPLGDKFALRTAIHYLHQGEGYHNNDKGEENETKEGRIKLLYQPNEKLSTLLSFSASQTQTYSGGWSQSLTAPDTIDYKAEYVEPGKDAPTKRRQGSLEINYDLEGGVLTYIAALHDSDSRGKSGVGLNKSSYQYAETSGEPFKTHTQELRLASDTDSFISWLVGANYYQYKFNKVSQTYQVRDLNSDDPASFNAHLFGQYNKGDITNYGIFTEETFELQDDFRITAGLRYDKTEIENYAGMDFNLNLGPFMVSYNPPEIVHFPSDATYSVDDLDFDNITYKLRLEYDLTPDKMLYALTSSGFLPGDSQINIAQSFSPPPDMTLVGVEFIKLPYKQQKLTSYEVGSKNRFLNNKLQLNASIFYYDYEGYQEAVNINPPGSPPPPNFIVLRVPVRMYGFEMNSTWILSPYDKLTFSGGWLDARLKSYPTIPGGTESAKAYMYLKRVPALPEYSGALSYDHTFIFGNGSSLVPRAEAHYTSGYYLAQLSTAEAATSDDEGNSYKDYLYQKGALLINLGATWSSPDDKYSITGYVRNATDLEYKTSATLPVGTPLVNTEAGDPRTYGILASVRF